MAIALSGSLILSGSITVSGSIISTGTISMSGSIASASYANNATLAANSTLFNSTASTVFATTSSNTFVGNQTVTGSLIITGSQTFIGTKTITGSVFITGSKTLIGTNTVTGSMLISGSLTATGTITAQTLVVQTVTSSTVYSSGSNIFGNALANTQTFTGSVLVTGSLTISTGGNASAPTIFGSTIACSPIGCFATSCATSFIGGTMSGTTIYGSTAVCSPIGLFSGCVGIGGADQGYQLDVKRTSTGDSTFDTVANFYKASTHNTGLLLRLKNTIVDLAANNITGGGGPTAGMSFSVSSGGVISTALTITPTGIACFSNTACACIFTAATISAGIPTNSRIVANANTMYGYYDVEVNPRWTLGRDVWAGGSGGLAFGVGGNTTCYSMIGNPDGYGCTIAFATLVPTGCSGTTYEKMRITSGGNVGIGTSSPLQTSANRTVLTVNGTSSSIVNFGINGTLSSYIYADATTSGFYSQGGLYIDAAGVNSVIFNTNGCERMRITSCGKVGIIATDPKWLLEICCNTTATGGGGYPAISINNPNDAGYSAYYFFKGSTNMGGLELSNATCHLFINSLNTFAIQSNGVERLRVNNNGFIGVATNSPKAQLDVACGNAHSTISTWCKGATNGVMYNAFDIVMDEASFAGQLYVQANGAGIGIQATYDVLASYDRLCIIPRSSMTRGQGETLTIPSYTAGAGSKRICIQQNNTSGTGVNITAMLIGTAYGGTYICAQA